LQYLLLHGDVSCLCHSFFVLYLVAPQLHTAEKAHMLQSNLAAMFSYLSGTRPRISGMIEWNYQFKGQWYICLLWWWRRYGASFAV
jgi:hypothetical protein